MIDLWNKIVEKLHLPRVLDYRRYTVLAGIISLPFIMSGCGMFEATVDSLLSDSKKVNRAQYEAEYEIKLTQLVEELQAAERKLEALKKRGEKDRGELERQQGVIDEIKTKVASIIKPLVPPQYAGISEIVFGLLGIGGLTDAARARAYAKDAKAEVAKSAKKK